MPESVYRVLTLLVAVTATPPIGTNLRLLHVLWMLVSGRLLASRGALFLGLQEAGLSAGAMRRARRRWGGGGEQAAGWPSDGRSW